MVRADERTFPFPVLDALHRRSHDAHLLLDIQHTWGQRHGAGGPLPLEHDEQLVRKALAGNTGILPLSPQVACPGGMGGRIDMNPWPVPWSGTRGDDPPRVPYLEEWQYLQFSVGDVPIHALERYRDDIWTWFVYHAGEAALRIRPQFCLASESDDQCVPGLRDPRVRVWPATYYGPRLVDALGRDRLLDAPAWRVEEHATGGIWLHLHETPLSAPEETEEVRAVVEAHLRPATTNLPPIA